MSRTRVKALAVAVTFVAVAGWRLLPGPRLFGAHVTGVVLQRQGTTAPGEIQFNDPATVARYVNALQLHETAPCRCAHIESVRFLTGTGSIDASVCSHCLDIRKGVQTKHCKMPPELYALISSAWDSANAVVAPVGGPIR